MAVATDVNERPRAAETSKTDIASPPAPPKKRKPKHLPRYDAPALMRPHQMAEMLVEIRARERDLQQRVGYLETALLQAIKPPKKGLAAVANQIDGE